MNKKNVYMVQVDHIYGNEENSLYLPYATGLIAAYAWADEKIKNSYSLAGFKIWREDINASVDSLVDPFLVGFSCYIWNTEYNKAFAKRLKEVHPECIVVFGGHNVPGGTSMLEEFGYIDILVHGEGEDAFKRLLCAFTGSGDLSDVDNISYRNDSNDIIQTTSSPVADIDLPSPYLEGIFDDLMEKDEFNFCAIIETNRGCPNHCTYCDWGRLGSKFKMFPIDRVFQEIDWMAEHKIEYFWCADSSFGLFERDHDIIDHLIAKKLETGFPKIFKANYAERREIEVYDICKKLNKINMNKGATLSFQSLDPTVLKNINRRNITMERFAEMMSLYNDANIATYAELILGLPGETYESFRHGVETLLEAGQHNALNLHALVLLPNSQMAQPEYMKEFGIKTVRTEFSQFHCEVMPNDIPEYYDLVVATNSMDAAMWVRSTMFFIYIQSYHQLGLLQFFAIYLFYEKNVKYHEFYNSLIEWSEKSDQTISGKIYSKFNEKLSGIHSATGSRCYTNPVYGNAIWPLEEGVFLEILQNYDRFYEEIEDFLQTFKIDPSIYSNLMTYQKGMIKQPGLGKSEISLTVDLYNYFKNIYVHTYTPLEKKKNVLILEDKNYAKTWKAYAIENVWYGRNDSRCIFSDIRVDYI